MSQLDQFLSYLSTINESTIQLTKQDYQKICAIRDRVTEIAAKVPQKPQPQPKTVSVKEKTKIQVYQAVNESTIITFDNYFRKN